MRRKPLCLTFLLIFAASVFFSNRILAERIALLPESAGPSISAPIEAPEDSPSTPDDLSVESPAADPSAAPVDQPVDAPVEIPAEVQDETVSDLPAATSAVPSETAPPEETPANPPEETPPTPVASENYFIRVASPREVIAMLTAVDVPRTGGESISSGAIVDALGGVANASDGFGAGSNLFSDASSASDLVSAAISASSIAQFEPAHSSLWLNLLITLISLLTLLGLFSVVAHFLR